MKAYTITPKGQITIPAEIREKLKLYPGDKITYEDTVAGILLKPAKKDMLDDFGFLKERMHSEDLEEIRNIDFTDAIVASSAMKNHINYEKQSNKISMIFKSSNYSLSNY